MFIGMAVWWWQRKKASLFKNVELQNQIKTRLSLSSLSINLSSLQLSCYTAKYIVDYTSISPDDTFSWDSDSQSCMIFDGKVKMLI